MLTPIHQLTSFIFAALLLAPLASLPAATVTKLRCEYLENPLGIDAIRPQLASADTWLYQGLAGIRPDLAAPGFKQMIINPAVVGALTWVKCHHDSPYGRIVSNWKREGQKLTMEVTIPANTTATVRVPARAETGVTESGKPAAKAMGVKFLRKENNAAVYAVGSGTYRFGSSLADTVR